MGEQNYLVIRRWRMKTIRSEKRKINFGYIPYIFIQEYYCKCCLKKIYRCNTIITKKLSNGFKKLKMVLLTIILRSWWWFFLFATGMFASATIILFLLRATTVISTNRTRSRTIIGLPHYQEKYNRNALRYVTNRSQAGQK